MKALIILLVLIVIGIAVYFLSQKLAPVQPQVTIDETDTLSEQINTLTDEQLSAMSTDMSDFNNATEDSLAGDISLFYYE